MKRQSTRFLEKISILLLLSAKAIQIPHTAIKTRTTEKSFYSGYSIDKVTGVRYWSIAILEDVQVTYLGKEESYVEVELRIFNDEWINSQQKIINKKFTKVSRSLLHPFSRCLKISKKRNGY